MPKKEEFDFDIINSQENLYNNQKFYLDFAEDSVWQSWVDKLDNEGGRGLEEWLWPREMLGTT